METVDTSTIDKTIANLEMALTMLSEARDPADVAGEKRGRHRVHAVLGPCSASSGAGNDTSGRSGAQRGQCDEFE